MSAVKDGHETDLEDESLPCVYYIREERADSDFVEFQRDKPQVGKCLSV